MRAVFAHVRKEWRDHRAVLLGILAAIPCLTALGCWAFSEWIAGIDRAAPAFVGGSVAMTVLALSTELWAGDAARGTLALSRRQPRGLAAALAGKTLFYLLACAATGAYAALALAGVGSAFAGGTVGGHVLLAATSEPLTWFYAGAATVFGLWVLLASTWVPRGAAAAGAAALLLGAIAFPGWMAHRAFPTFRPDEDDVRAVAWALAVVPVLVTAVCVLRGLRFSGSTWGAAWRGIALVFPLAGGGYAYGAHAFHRWLDLAPDDPEMRISHGFLGAGGRFAFLEVYRAEAGPRGAVPGSDRPWAVDLGTGAWTQLGDPGAVITAVEPAGSDEYVAKGLGLVQVRRGDVRWDDVQDVRYVDGDTGRVWKTLPSDVQTPDLLARLLQERRRLSPVRDAQGHGAWWSWRDHALQRERGDGSVETIRLPPSGGWLGTADAWGWYEHAYDGVHGRWIDPFAPEPFAEPLAARDALTRGWRRLDPAHALGNPGPGGRERPLLVVDLRAGTSAPALGLDGRMDVVLAVLPASRVAALRVDVHANPHVATLDRVDPSTGDRVPIPLPRGVDGPMEAVMALYAPPAGRAVLRIELASGATGYARLSEDGTRMSDWAPAGASGEAFVGLSGGDGLIVVADGRRIERARWGSGKREVLFPR